MLFAQVPTAREYPIARARERGAEYYRKYVASAPPEIRDLLFARGSRNHRHDYFIVLFNNYYSKIQDIDDDNLLLEVGIYPRTGRAVNCVIRDKFAAVRAEYANLPNQIYSVHFEIEEIYKIGAHIPRGMFADIKHLLLSDCSYMKCIPRAVARMRHLFELFVGGQSINRIPRFITKCKECILLNMYSNQIREIPKYFKKNTYFELDLSENPISVIKNIKMRNGGRLDLGYCNISRIPIKQMNNLRLELVNNPIVKVPTSEEFQKMGRGYIDISEHYRHIIPENTHRVVCSFHG